MITITIPEKLTTEEELVVVPRREYEGLIGLKLRNVQEVSLTKAEKKALEEARAEFRRGEYVVWDKVKHELGINRRQTSPKRTRPVSPKRPRAHAHH